MNLISTVAPKKQLGVVLDDRLKCKSYMSSICKKAS